MNILLTGSTGQVGGELVGRLKHLGHLHSPGRDECDLANLKSLRAYLRELRPDIVINTAAFTAVDKAESDSEMAHRINADAVAVLAEEVERLKGMFVHFSTDYVFDGSGVEPWKETDVTKPLNEYGKSKLAGERLITQLMADNSDWWILRTSWVYSGLGNNFAKTMFDLCLQREELQIIDDQVGAPTSAEWLSEVALEFIKKKPQSGIYHVAAAGETNWHGYASHLIEHARQLGAPVKTSKKGIRRITSRDFPQPALRPRNSRLDTNKLKQELGSVPPHWALDVERVVTSWVGAQNK